MFLKITETDKPLTKLTKRRREKIEMNKIGDEKKLGQNSQ